MAEQRWLGGATTTAQIATQTVGGTWAQTETLTTTLTAEDGSTTNVETTVAAASPSVTNVRDEHLADLQAVTTGLFAAITWAASSTDKITATAKVAGTPFYISLAETSTSGTYTSAATQANSGPNDWETAANWSSAVPSDGDDVKFLTGSEPLLFGLRPGNGAGNQGGTPISLASLRIGPGYTGAIGQNNNGYYLKLDPTEITCESNCKWIWIESTAVSTINVTRLPDSLDALHLSGSWTSWRFLGPSVRGKITIADSSSSALIRTSECTGLFVQIGLDVTSLTAWDINAGTVKSKSGNATATVNASGASTALIFEADVDEGLNDINNRGALIEYNGSGTIDGTWTNHYGTSSLANSEAEAVTIDAVVVEGGLFTDRSGLQNVTYTGDNLVHNGGNVQLDSGYSLAKS